MRRIHDQNNKRIITRLFGMPARSLHHITGYAFPYLTHAVIRSKQNVLLLCTILIHTTTLYGLRNVEVVLIQPHSESNAYGERCARVSHYRSLAAHIKTTAHIGYMDSVLSFAFIRQVGRKRIGSNKRPIRC